MSDSESRDDISSEEFREGVLLERVLENNSELLFLKGVLTKNRAALNVARQIVESQVDAIAFVDTSLRIVYANSVFCRMVGYELSDLEKMMIDQFFMLQGRGPSLATLLKTVSRQGHWSGEVLFRQGGQEQLPLVGRVVRKQDVRQVRTVIAHNESGPTGEFVVPVVPVCHYSTLAFDAGCLLDVPGGLIGYCRQACDGLWRRTNGGEPACALLPNMRALADADELFQRIGQRVAGYELAAGSQKRRNLSGDIIGHIRIIRKDD